VSGLNDAIPIAIGDTITGTLDEKTQPYIEYEINLNSGDWLTAILTGAEGTDFDLYLEDSNRELIEFSVEPDTSREQFSTIIYSTGTYYLVVEVYSGSGEYTLKVTDEHLPDSGDAIEIADDITIGEQPSIRIGNTRYTSYNNEFLVINVSNQSKPSIIGRFQLRYPLVEMAIGDLVVLDLTDRSLPYLFGRSVHDTSLLKTIYAIDIANYLLIFNITDPTKPELFNTYNLDIYAYDAPFSENLVYKIDELDNIVIYNITNPYDNLEITEILDVNNVVLIDITDPNNPKEIISEFENIYIYIALFLFFMLVLIVVVHKLKKRPPKIDKYILNIQKSNKDHIIIELDQVKHLFFGYIQYLKPIIHTKPRDVSQMAKEIMENMNELREEINGFRSKVREKPREYYNSEYQHLNESFRRYILKIGENISNCLWRMRGILLESKDPTRYLGINTELLSIPWELCRYRGNFLFENNILYRTVPIQKKSGFKFHHLPTFLYISDPTESLRGADLEEASLEILRYNLSNLFRIEIERGLTLKGFKEILEEGGCDIIHYTGHGEYKDTNGNEEVLIYFKDKCINDKEASFLKINEKYPPKIVFFNACNTAALENFAKIFIENGAICFIGTLWDIEDLIAVRFASLFYINLFREKLSIAESFIQAKIQIKNERDNFSVLGYVLYTSDPNWRV